MAQGTPFSRSRSERREFWVAMVFILPWIVGILVFTLYPILRSLYFSLTEYGVIHDPEFIGLANYANLAKDKTFHTALFNTMYIVLLGVPVTLFSAFTISVLLNSKELRRLTFFRVAFFVPTLMPLIINCILWIWLLNPENGLVNAILGVGVYGDRRGLALRHGPNRPSS